MTRPTVGLIGYGRFGKLAATYISRYARVVVHDPAFKRARSPGREIRPATLPEAAGQHILVLAVPVSSLRNVLLSIRSLVRPGALVLDVCAVKAKPVAWMKQLLPRTVDILGTHPLFGPESAAGSLRGHTVVLCPVRCSRRKLARTARFLRKAGLKVVLMAPGDHDRRVAAPLFLAQYLGRVAAHAALPAPLGTPSSRKLGQVARMAEQESVQVFHDLFRFNPSARKTRGGIARAIRNTEKLLRLR